MLIFLLLKIESLRRKRCYLEFQVGNKWKISTFTNLDISFGIAVAAIDFRKKNNVNSVECALHTQTHFYVFISLAVVEYFQRQNENQMNCVHECSVLHFQLADIYLCNDIVFKHSLIISKLQSEYSFKSY